MSPLIHYVDSVIGRRPQVLADLARAEVAVQVVEQLADLPPDAAIVLLGVDDLHAALPGLRGAADAAPHRQVILLWEGQDPALVIEAVRAGARDVLIAAQAVPEAVARACERAGGPALAPNRPRGRVVVVFSLKGGIGKSTLTANLAITLHRLSQRPTTAVDLSLPCGNLEMYLDVQPTRSIGDLLAAGEGLEAPAIQQALARHPSGISVLAGPRAQAVEALTRASCQPLLAELGAEGGITVVDLGAFLEYAHASVLEAADLVVVPVTPLISSLGTLGQARELLAGFGVPPGQILPVLNHAGPDTAQLTAEAVASLMGGAPAHVLPWGGADVAASLNAGLPVCQHRPYSPLAVAIEGVARDALERLGVAAAVPLATRPTPAKVSVFAWLRHLLMPKGIAHVHP